MDNQETGSNQAPQSTEKDRLAGLLKQQYGSDFAYEAPDAPEPESQPDVVEQPTDEATETQPDAEAATDTSEAPKGQPEDEFETVDVEGTEYRIPKELKDHLLRDKDYRHKTMELADIRKSVEAEKYFVAHAKAAAQHLAPLLAQAGVLESQLQQLDQTNWQELYQTDPLQFSNLQHMRRNLVDQRNALGNQFGQAVSAIDKAEFAAIAAESERNEPIVRRAIKDWGPQKQKELSEGATNVYGFGAEELQRLTDARMVMVLNDAIAYRKLMANKPKAITAVKQAPPVSRQNQTRANEAPNVELKKAEARLSKTGEQEDLYHVLRLRAGRR